MIYFMNVSFVVVDTPCNKQDIYDFSQSIASTPLTVMSSRMVLSHRCHMHVFYNARVHVTTNRCSAERHRRLHIRIDAHYTYR